VADWIHLNNEVICYVTPVQSGTHLPMFRTNIWLL